MADQSPTADELAARLAALYAAAEAVIIRTGSQLAAGDLALFVQALRRTLGPLVDLLTAQSNVLVTAMVTQAASEGARRASHDVAVASHGLVPAGGSDGRVPTGRALTFGDEPFDLSLDHGEHAARAIINDLDNGLEDVRKRITRLPDDVYKFIAPHGAIGQVRDNGVTPAQAQAAAWRVFVQNGVTGFTDKSGRGWSISAYTEMAIRTASQRAFNDSHMRRMQAIGVKYFTVPEHKGACPLCYPWQHKILTQGLNDNPDVHADGTVDEAIARGLFHPNCRHTLLPYFPGVTSLTALPQWSDDHQAAYDANQHQRAIERDIRKAKRALDAAASPEDRAAARVKVRRQQARMRDFLATRDDLSRDSRREQLQFSNQKIKMPHLGG